MANSSWTVTSQQTGQTINDDAGNTVVGTYVFFTTGQGNKGSVFIPDAKYGTKYVAEQVRERANLIDAVGNLSENNG
jgi:hypothetical protein